MASVVRPATTGNPERAAQFHEWASRTLAFGMLPGFVAGLIVGGFGSRLAMRVMALTSPAARGFETDFGATIGKITPGGTLFLLIAGSVLGMLGGILYLAVRPVLPGRGVVRGLVFGGLLLALLGRFLVDPGNPDFVILEPAGLAVAMFAALPILYGLLFVPLAEWLEPRIARVRRPLLLIVPVLIGLAPLVLAGGLGIAVIAGVVVAWVIKGSIQEQGLPFLRVAGVVGLGSLGVWRGVLFLTGVLDILR
jgi:hypothetical protein